MRKVCLLMLIIMTLLLTSCSSGDSNMVRDLFKKNERETANERFEALIGAHSKSRPCRSESILF